LFVVMLCKHLDYKFVDRQVAQVLLNMRSHVPHVYLSVSK